MATSAIFFKERGQMMKLFIIHAGYYDSEIGIYELHTNFFVASVDPREAKEKIKKNEIFRKKSMHIDAIQEINTVDGHKVALIKADSDETILNSYDYSQIKNMETI
jgi:hypothetical protein